MFGALESHTHTVYMSRVVENNWHKYDTYSEKFMGTKCWTTHTYTCQHELSRKYETCLPFIFCVWKKTSCLFLTCVIYCHNCMLGINVWQINVILEKK